MDSDEIISLAMGWKKARNSVTRTYSGVYALKAVGGASLVGTCRRSYASALAVIGMASLRGSRYRRFVEARRCGDCFAEAVVAPVLSGKSGAEGNRQIFGGACSFETPFGSFKDKAGHERGGYEWR